MRHEQKLKKTARGGDRFANMGTPERARQFTPSDGMDPFCQPVSGHSACHILVITQLMRNQVRVHDSRSSVQISATVTSCNGIVLLDLGGTKGNRRDAICIRFANQRRCDSLTAEKMTRIFSQPMDFGAAVDVDNTSKSKESEGC